MHTVQLTDDMEEMFRAVAAQTGRPLDELIRDALNHFLEEWEDARDAEDAERAYHAFEESGEAGTPWEVVKAEMDRKHGL
ncbi:MAG: ribbon-helix-helix protein, CopG family [Magnetococcales bacterium]|nr:ribbon-helix-helix protein, CopG family [Magnetococcales bacterium]